MSACFMSPLLPDSIFSVCSNVFRGPPPSTFWNCRWNYYTISLARCCTFRACMTQLPRDIVVVGASAGGVQALQRLVADLPNDFPAAVFVVLHIWPGSPSLLPEILSRAGQLQVVEAENGAPIKRGTVFVAPTDMHLMLEQDRMVVVRGPRENRARP